MAGCLQIIKMIRKAKLTDIEEIHNLDKESVKFHKKFDRDFYTISDKWWEIKKNSQIKALKKPTNLILVVEINKIIVGYIWGSISKFNKYKLGCIQELAVTSKHRKKGIASNLLKGLLDFLKKEGCIICEVNVFVKNNVANNFYEKFGFKKREYKLQLKLNKNKKFKPFF